jgi:hypothetical protein
MKKTYILLITAGMALTCFAGEPDLKKRNGILLKQDNGGEKCFNESTHIINLGVGIGSRPYHSFYGYPGHKYGRTPAFSLTYEQAWPKKLGPGYLGIGAYLGYQREYYNYDYDDIWFNTKYYYHHNWSYYMIAARGAYHWDVLNAKNAEVYAGVLVGLRIQTHNYETNDPDKRDPYTYSTSAVYPTYSVFAGARWYFVPNFGLFAEVGYGISYLTGGLSIKF